MTLLTKTCDMRKLTQNKLKTEKDACLCHTCSRYEGTMKKHPNRTNEIHIIKEYSTNNYQTLNDRNLSLNSW